MADMKFQLVRTHGTDSETMGYLNIDNKHFCYTLEDPVRVVKIKADTCIPYGKYKMQLTWSPRFKRLVPLLYNRPNFNVVAANGDTWSGIRLHGGNNHLDTEGCPLLAYNQHLNKPTKVVKNGKTYTIDNWIQGTAEHDFTKLLKESVVYDFEIIHTEQKVAGLTRIIHFTSPLMKGDDIFAIQTRLVQLGYNPGSVDMWFGEKTKLAIQAFQRDKSLTIDGVVGDKTWSELFKN